MPTYYALHDLNMRLAIQRCFCTSPTLQRPITRIWNVSTLFLRYKLIKQFIVGENYKLKQWRRWRMWAQHSALTQLKQKKRNLFVCVYQTLFMGVPQITNEVFASRAKWNRKLIFRTSNIIDWGEKNKFKFLINNALLSMLRFPLVTDVRGSSSKKDFTRKRNLFRGCWLKEFFADSSMVAIDNWFWWAGWESS